MNGPKNNYAVSFFFLWFLASVVQAGEIGEILRTRGSSLLWHGGASTQLAAHARIAEGDRLETGDDARIDIRLVDGSLLTLSANTVFSFDKFRFAENQRGNEAAFGLAKGAFRAITGAVTKGPGHKVAVRTPIAVIGVRGTDFWGGFTLADGALDVVMLDGKGVFVKNPYGIAELDKPGVGTTVYYAVDAEGRQVAQEQAPTEPKVWGEAKLDKARGSVSW